MSDDFLLSPWKEWQRLESILLAASAVAQTVITSFTLMNNVLGTSGPLSSFPLGK